MMKKSLCFAGFGADELASLQQAMAGISGRWDCTFVADAAGALEAMSGKPFDAIVATMQMNGMNGAELLQRAGELHQGALRFVVGDLADQELILNCIGGTHQFISRPYKPQELISIIQRSFALDACLSSDQLRAIAHKLGRLPTLPSTYFEVLKRVESRDASAESVAEVIARDPAATARVLQVVNSAAFALAQKVSDPAQAVLLLGLDTVKSLVLCLQVFNRVERAKNAGFSLEQLWDHSSTVAKYARDIALHQSLDPRMGNDAFTAGLLHDVGRIVLASNMAKEYGAVVVAARQKSCPLHEEELVQLGVTHAQVGAYLLGLWGMPASLVEAAALHHVPGQASSPEFSLLTAVHAANVFAHENDKPDAGLPLPQLDTEYLTLLSLDHKVPVWRKVISGAASTGDTERVSRPAPQTAPAQRSAAKSGFPKLTPAAKPSSAPAKPAAVPEKRAAATATGSRRSRLQRVLAPAVAAVLVVGAVAWLKARSGSGDNLPVRARTPDTTPAADSKSAPETAAPAQADVLAAPKLDAAAVNTSARSAPVAATDSPAVSFANGKPVGSSLHPVAMGLDSVKVQGIFYSANQPVVIINGKPLGVGDHLGDVQVVSISPTSVVLSSNGQKKVIKVK
jgi:HD-like signal output (HDOD) protein/CheY-like chemotaxis protein